MHSHFERLCPEAWADEGQAIAAAEAAIAAQVAVDKLAAEKARKTEEEEAEKIAKKRKLVGMKIDADKFVAEAASVATRKPEEQSDSSEDEELAVQTSEGEVCSRRNKAIRLHFGPRTA